MHLAQLQPGEMTTVSALSSRLNWTQNHIVKVVHRLGLEGWIISQRGRQGGIRLAKEPAEYWIGDIISRLEGPETLIDCQDPPCSLESVCIFKKTLAKGLEAFYNTLNRVTLADLALDPVIVPSLAFEPDDKRMIRIQPSHRKGAEANRLTADEQADFDRKAAIRPANASLVDHDDDFGY